MMNKKMSDSNNNDFLKGFSAIDDDDRISPEEPSDGRVEPSLSDDLFKNSKKNTNSNESSDESRVFVADSSGNVKVEPNQNSSSSHDGDDNNPNGKKKKTIKKRLFVASLKMSLAGLCVLSVLVVYFYMLIQEKFDVDDKWVLPAVVYSRPLELYPDQKLSLKQMLYELKLLKYRQVPNPQMPGEYALNEKTGRIVILRRPFEFPDGAEDKISLMVAFNGNRISRIVNADTHDDLGYVRMDPVLLDRINRIDPKEDRIFISLQDVPQSVITTLLEIEDRSFYSNMGVNFFAIARAFIKNTLAHQVVEGGSTITQQLVKNYFLSSEKSYTRKFKEIIMALIMNQRYTKDQILEAYLNEIYLGQNGSAGIYGFGLASYFYFGVPVSELSLEQGALLVGIIKGPSYYDPWRHPDAALERRNVVLSVLKSRGHITETEYEQYSARPLGVIKRGSMNYSKTPAFMGVLKREISSKFGPEFLSGNGIKIFSSLDPQAQQAAETAASEELSAIEKERKLNGLEVAMVVSSWRTAEVSAVVGSRTPQYAGFNRVTEGKRQVGSIIKPFVYLTAFHNGVHMGTLVNDAPISVKLSSGKLWQPHNDDKRYRGPIPTYVAMARSLNVPTVKIGMRVGLNNVRDTLMRVGIDKSRIPFYPSMLLGTVELTPFEVNQIYTSLATEGTYKDLTTLRTVVKDGKVVYERSETRTEPTLDLGGKTGTTNDSRDTWSIGIDSDSVVATWVGFDDNKPTGLFGSSGAMRVYGRFLKERGINSLELRKPEGVKFVRFNQSGNIVSDSCSMPGITILPARTDKIRYVDENCTISVSPQN